MDTRYATWIALHVPADPTNQCHKWAAKMAEAFPELRLVPGYYHCPASGADEHWWCVAPDGSVVDPTAAQFISRGLGEYEEVDTSNLPSGLCPNCGGYVYGGTTLCSEVCVTEYTAYVLTGRL